MPCINPHWNRRVSKKNHQIISICRLLNSFKVIFAGYFCILSIVSLCILISLEAKKPKVTRKKNSWVQIVQVRFLFRCSSYLIIIPACIRMIFMWCCEWFLFMDFHLRCATARTPCFMRLFSMPVRLLLISFVGCMCVLCCIRLPFVDFIFVDKLIRFNWKP